MKNTATHISDQFFRRAEKIWWLLLFSLPLDFLLLDSTLFRSGTPARLLPWAWFCLALGFIGSFREGICALAQNALQLQGRHREELTKAAWAGFFFSLIIIVVIVVKSLNKTSLVNILPPVFAALGAALSIFRAIIHSGDKKNAPEHGALRAHTQLFILGTLPAEATRAASLLFAAAAASAGTPESFFLYFIPAALILLHSKPEPQQFSPLCLRCLHRGHENLARFGFCTACAGRKRQTPSRRVRALPWEKKLTDFTLFLREKFGKRTGRDG